MNNHRGEPADEILLRQVDELLERGKRSDHAVMNMLADTVPQADAAFERRLEKLLVTQLQQSIQNKESNSMSTMTARASHTPTLTARAWAVAVVALVIVGGLTLLRLPGGSGGIPASQAPIEPPQTIVVATQNIHAGETITDGMVALVSLDNDAFATLQQSQPDRQFYHSVADVVGRVTTTAIFWFEPIDPIKLGDLSETCVPGSRYCLNVPAGYFTINLPNPIVSLAEQGLVTGDRVDVLAAADGTLTTIVRDVLLAEVTPEHVTLAATSWKQSVLIWLSGTEQPYMLRFASPETPTPTTDEARVEYHFTAPEPLPDGYLFDLIAEFPAAESYRLSDAPNLDAVQFTERDTTMNFWFTDLDVVSITDGTSVVIRLPGTDAANLDYLLAQGAELTFIPQTS